MELNSAIWGDETHQILQSSEYSNHVTVSDVIPDIYTYYNTIGMNESIDNSIALWQIGDDSWFNHQLFLRRDGNNVIQKNERTTVNAKSIWLCVPITYNTAQNIHFNPTQYQCNLWDAGSTSSYYNQPNANLRGIITGFDYNRLVLRHRLCCKLYNSETGIHSGNTRFFSTYEYFNGVDSSDNIPYREKYCVESLTCVVGTSKGDTEIFPYQISMNIPLNDPKNITESARIYTNTMYNTPSPANNYYKSTYQYYAQSNDVIGLQRTGRSSIPQQSVFADNTSFYIDGFASDKWVLDEFRDGSTDYIATRFTGTYDDIMRQLAFFGFWFVDNDTFGNTITAITGRNCNSEHVCLPEIIGGRTTGNYKRGVVAGADPQATWGNNWRDSVGYTGDKPYKNAQNDTGDLSSVFNRTFIGGSCKYYTMIGTDLRDLVSAINSGYQPTNNDQFVLDFKGSNPADYISSCLYYPDGFTCADRSTDNIALKIGALELAVTAHEADINAENIVSFSPVTIPALFGDFRDYSPYTSLDLYIPFCGSVELDPAVFVGHTLQVYLFIDFPTGNCAGVVMRDSLVYDTVNGTCGVSIPLTAQNVGQYQNAIKSAEIALKQAEMQRKTAWLAAAGSGATLIAGVATANPLAIAGGIGGLAGSAINVERANLSVESAEYNLSHTAPSVRSLSTASPANALQMDYDCHLIIKRATMSDGYDETIYSHTIGNACAINDVLSTFHGLTVCADADLTGIPCTADEKQQIMQMLKSGVYF